eukprot:6203479-Pleurochrysis_carterae.AAC.1
MITFAVRREEDALEADRPCISTAREKDVPATTCEPMMVCADALAAAQRSSSIVAAIQPEPRRTSWRRRRVAASSEVRSRAATRRRVTLLIGEVRHGMVRTPLTRM